MVVTSTLGTGDTTVVLFLGIPLTTPNQAREEITFLFHHGMIESSMVVVVIYS